MSLLKTKDKPIPLSLAASRLDMKIDSVRKGCGIAKNLKPFRLDNSPKARLYVLESEVDALLRARDLKIQTAKRGASR